MCLCVSTLALECGPNSNYSTCMTPCPSSCADLAAPSVCEQTVCVEGCQCAPGFTLSENDCVPFNQCGCTHLGRYFTVSLSMHVQYNRLEAKKVSKGWKKLHSLIIFVHHFCTQLRETFVTEDCSQNCECTATGAVCQPNACGDTEICSVFDTKRDCYKGKDYIMIDT